jgi:hypothetical protein
MRSIPIIPFAAALILGGAVFASAQMGVGMMGGGMPVNLAKMMQEQNKVLAQASIQYMTVFAHALHVQSKERRDQIDESFIKSALGEMKRAFEMIEKFQSAHVKTMDADMQMKVQPMMERMNRNLASVKKNLDDLGMEINGARDLEKIAFYSGEIITHLNDMPRRAGGMAGAEEKPGMKR